MKSDKMKEIAGRYINSRVDLDTLKKWHSKHPLYHKYTSTKMEEADNAINGIIVRALMIHVEKEYKKTRLVKA
jgi:hypothetical protein